MRKRMKQVWSRLLICRWLLGELEDHTSSWRSFVLDWVMFAGLAVFYPGRFDAVTAEARAWLETHDNAR